ncbi:sliding clamp holder [Erwinia phage phiEa2809]|uniref:Sliding-clamp-loader large subunit n=1 Tax=Erwinia phage phiEa2809 TaxID=1564096 RepID=A0A0A0YXH9_9CAUD|nr:clamp loader of DNA polymerase [Erwinia phage phiEa2809]AIX13103.1 sliding clamp holder [Erwinia phage phiEa2809]
MSLTVNLKEFGWDQKYRPDNLDEIILPNDIKLMLHNYIDEGKGKIPSFLFYSPGPGTGKTTTAFAVCNEIGCKKPLFINASLNNSIDTIREHVLQYATGVSVFGGTKVVILDEVERLSAAAQESLKGIVERVSANCAFILTTNAKMRVNEPLRSRCREIDFIWTKEEADQVKLRMMQRCAQVLTAENIPFENAVIAAIVQKHFPDNRKIMGEFQKAAVKYKAIDERALAAMKSVDMSTLVESLKSKQTWPEMKQWVTDNQNDINEDFYTRFFQFCVPQSKDKTPLIESQSIPDLVAICGQAQIHHRQVGDVWLHAVYFLTDIMSTVKWR